MISKNRAGPESSPCAGVVVIGRNEGDRLRAALASVDGDATAIVYVDSGSTDGSVETARAMGVVAHELDPGRPFSAARARREGVDVLLERWPSVEYIQFVDGDCALNDGWMERAAAILEEDASIGVVCGMLAEASPDASIYNRVCDLQWRVPAGDVASCGGLFMIRRDAYEQAGGFNAVLLTREERDLCTRVRQCEYRIVRINAPMAEHDAALLTFGDWWRRAVWGGYGNALEIDEKRGRLTIDDWQRVRRYLTWPAALPMLAVAGGIATVWSVWFAVLPAVCAAMYLLLFARIAGWRLRCGDTVKQAGGYAALSIVRKFATGYGFVRYFVMGGNGSRRPDPHAADETHASISRHVPASSDESSPPEAQRSAAKSQL